MTSPDVTSPAARAAVVAHAVASGLARARYRARQFARGLRPALTPAEVTQARARLSPAEWALFLAQEPRDRRHALDLHRALLEVGAGDALLAAALLHDVGKGPLHVWQRVAFVVLEAGAPALARALEAEAGPGWRHGLWRLRHHAHLGAAMLAAAGSAPRVVALVAGHAGEGPSAQLDGDAELSLLIALDDRL